MVARLYDATACGRAHDALCKQMQLHSMSQRSVMILSLLVCLVNLLVLHYTQYYAYSAIVLILVMLLHIILLSLLSYVTTHSRIKICGGLIVWSAGRT